MSFEAKTSFKPVNPKPPTPLNKETIGVWSGWGNIGDKEVARESAAKGLHINLAINFLSIRKNINLEDAQIWFKNEVITWVYELLERGQIFKASHVLNNIGLDPGLEFSKIFYSTVKNDLREYIGKHLMKTGKLDKKFRHLWSFLILILENDVLLSNYELPSNSIECLDNQANDWKAEVATILFLRTDDDRLVEFLNAETLWKYLLTNQDLDNLLIWINLKYNSNFEDVVDRNIIGQFKKFPITNEMLSLVSKDELDIPIAFRNSVYDEFSKYGMFQYEEKNNFIVILQRLKNVFSIPNLYQILAKNSSVVSVNSFIKLLIDYCVKNQLFSILNVCLKNFKINSDISNHLNLINDFRLLVNDFNEISLRNNIYNVSNILSADVISYYNENPVILLALFFFTKDVEFIDLFTEKTTSVINETKLDDCLLNMLTKFPIMKAISVNKIKRTLSSELTIYNLIDKHVEINSKYLFEFRFNDRKLPHFNSVEIVQTHSYSKQIDYKFYLRQSRPSIAAKLLILNELEVYDCVNNDNLKRIERKVLKLGMSNFDCDEIISSCIAFIEIIGLDSDKLRIMVKIAKILCKSGSAKESVLELLLNSDDEPCSVQNHLETILIDIVESNPFLTGYQLIDAFKVYEIVVQYSKLSNIKLPEMFLKYFASRNLWLPFLTFAQIHNYPLDQVKLLIQFFKSPNMLEHLTHGVVNDIQVEEKNVLIRERDSRKYFLSKVGVRKNIELLNQIPTQSVLSQSSLESESSSTSSDFCEIDISNIKATLLQTLIRCHNSTDPPKALLQACQLYRNPLLAILATSYEPDSIITNWLTWLAVSCELCQVFTNYEATAISAKSVTNLLENCMKNRYPKTLLESFEIFIPENPLKIFLEFLNNCFKLNFNNTLLVLKLETFKASLKNARKNSMFNENDHEMTYLNNRIWIETTALRLLSALLESNCRSLYEQILITEHLYEVQIWEYFSCDCPQFENFLNILKALYDSKSGVRLDISIIFDTKNSRQAVITCINELLEKHHFDVALKIAQIENLPPDLILIKEWQNKMNDRNEQNFWSNCNEIFFKYNVTADCVVDFYIECSEKLSDFLEKFSLLKLAWEWAAKYELTCQHELEKKMWIAFLCLDEKHKSLDIFNIKPTVYLYKDLSEILKTICVYEGELSKDFLSQLDRIVAFALNKSDFWLALRLQKMFECKNTDLETLKLCHSLAEGILLPYQLNAEQRLLLSNVNYLKTHNHKKTLLSTRLSSFSSSSHSPANSLLIQTTDCIDSSMNDTLAILKLLSEHLCQGVEIGQNIFMSYRISINIEIPYQIVVVTADYMKILKYALEENCMNKLDVVHDFIWVFKWSKHEVADFICEELINATSHYIHTKTDHFIMWDLNIDQDFQLIMQLLPDNCSILGHKIYSYANTLHKAQVESNSVIKPIDLALVIELLIRAHDCFTADCNMEGISVILKKSKEVISNLLIVQDWKLIVRLLTGVARYTEMNYVFQILMENEEFEFLLRKGLKKDNALKVALLEYLKRFCPDNRDLYKIVALHFTLFSEVAMLWEREAQSIIKNLISISKLEMQNNKMNPDEEPFILFQNTDGTKICLNKAMENYTHATDFHLQGEKLSKAMTSAKQAELIALQLGILTEIPAGGSTVCLLDLNNNQVFSLISSKLSFEQSMILIEAYNFHVDWASVLYEQYVVKNNILFLEGFLKHLPLTDTLAHDISRKFIISNINSISEIKCMKNILNCLSSLHMKYRIASELGFTDLIEDLIASGQLVYLKDTVWKKGYKN